MLLQLVNVLYVLVAVAMIALILMQRGAGAQAGSGFGGGASSTVFGARGASNFLSKSTKWLAIVFFVVSMGIPMYASRPARHATLEPRPALRDADEASFDTLLDLLDEAARDWAGRDVPFWAFLALPEDDFEGQAE
jgi:preprotein translocase subunit SecG